MKSTIKKVVIQPKQEEITRDIVVLEMSKREAAALYILWQTSVWFPVSLNSLHYVLGLNPNAIEDDAFDNEKYSDYNVIVTKEAREWVNSFDGNGK